MAKERSELNLDDDQEESIDIREMAGPMRKDKNIKDPEIIKAAAEHLGFPSREGARTSRRRKRSPFTQQLGLKCRPQMRDLFQELGEHLGTYDHTTFERAILALIEKEGTEDHKLLYNTIINNFKIN